MSTYDAKQSEFRREVGRKMREGVAKFWPDENHHLRGGAFRYKGNGVRAVCMAQMLKEVFQLLTWDEAYSDPRLRLAARTILGLPPWDEKDCSIVQSLAHMNDERFVDAGGIRPRHSFEELRGMVLKAADELDPPPPPAVVKAPARELELA